MKPSSSEEDTAENSLVLCCAPLLKQARRSRDWMRHQRHRHAARSGRRYARFSLRSLKHFSRQTDNMNERVDNWQRTGNWNSDQMKLAQAPELSRTEARGIQLASRSARSVPRSKSGMCGSRSSRKRQGSVVARCINDRFQATPRRSERLTDCGRYSLTKPIMTLS